MFKIVRVGATEMLGYYYLGLAFPTHSISFLLFFNNYNLKDRFLKNVFNMDAQPIEAPLVSRSGVVCVVGGHYIKYNGFGKAIKAQFGCVLVPCLIPILFLSIALMNL